MTAHSSSILSMPRFLLLVLAGVGPAMLAYWYYEPPARQPIKVLTQPAQPATSIAQQTWEQPIPSNPVTVTHGVTGKKVPRQVASASTGSESSPPSPRSFKFLGKLTQEGKTVLLLHCCGRILTVTGTGPIGDGYLVEAIHDDKLVLRHETLGEVQILPLTFKQPSVAAIGSPDDTPQD